MKAPLAAVPGWRRLMEQAARLDLHIVRKLTGCTRYRLLRSAVIAINILGNGWIYLPLIVIIPLSGIPFPLQVMQAALVATGMGHLFHFLLKRHIARLRPFEKDPSLDSLIGVLDKYSFPSGHCMTMTTVLVPLVLVAPAMMPFASAILVLLASCRMIAAHHYPSDVLAGICLGAGVAIPVSAWLLPL